MIRIDMTAKISLRRETLGARKDVATATWDGQIYRAESYKGASMALARLLVAAGCPDQPYEAGRKGKRDFYGPSLHRLAKLAVAEPDSGGGPRFIEWQPRPEIAA